MVGRATEAHAVGMQLEVDGSTGERRRHLIENLALGLPVKRSQDLDLNDLLPVVGGLDARRDGVSTSRVDATATRSETYVDITRGRHENHLYLTATTDPLDGEALPRIPSAPADLAVADRLHRSTGELTAWELANPAEQTEAIEHAIGI